MGVGPAMVKPKKLGHLVLRVRDLTRSERFYVNVLGLNVREKLSGEMVFLNASDGASHELALVAAGEDAGKPKVNGAGLYHFAWEMESFEELRVMYRDLIEKGINIEGIGDHGISLGVYFSDPDGNNIEVFYELPKEQWPERDVFSGKFPWRLD